MVDDTMEVDPASKFLNPMDPGVAEAGGSFAAVGSYNNMILQQNLNNLGQQLSQLSPADLEQFNQIAAGVGIGSVAGVAGVIGAVKFGDMFMSVMRRTMSMAKKKVNVDTEEIIKLRRQIVSIHKRLTTLKTEAAVAKYQAMLKQAFEVLKELEARQGNRVAEGLGKDTRAISKNKLIHLLKIAVANSNDRREYALMTQAKEMFGDNWADDAYEYAALHNQNLNSDTFLDANNEEMQELAGRLGIKHSDYSSTSGVAEGKPQKRADRYHINKDGKPASLSSYADRANAVKDRDAKYPDAKVHQVGPRGKVKGEFEEGVAEGELTAYQKLLKQMRQTAKNDPNRIPRGYELTAHGELVKNIGRAHV
jgi:hypothetical protein